MTNEEFQKLLLDEIRGLRSDINRIESKVDGLETKIDYFDIKADNLNLKVDKLEYGQNSAKKDLKAIIEQTANLTEFREEVNIKLDKIKNTSKNIEKFIDKDD